MRKYTSCHYSLSVPFLRGASAFGRCAKANFDCPEIEKSDEKLTGMTGINEIKNKQIPVYPVIPVNSLLYLS